VLTGAGAATNEVIVNLSIVDAGSGKLIFNYDHKFSGGIGSSPSSLVDGLMKQCSRKMPYFNNN
jgi:hypothetical protein